MKSLFQVLTRQPKSTRFPANCWNNDADRVGQSGCMSYFAWPVLVPIQCKPALCAGFIKFLYIPVINSRDIELSQASFFAVDAANVLSVTRGLVEILSFIWGFTSLNRLQLLMVWEIGPNRPESPCRYLKTVKYFSSFLGGFTHYRKLRELIRLGNEKVGKMYPSFRPGPRVFISTYRSTTMATLPDEMLWTMFQNLTVIGELLPPGQDFKYSRIL